MNSSPTVNNLIAPTVAPSTSSAASAAKRVAVDDARSNDFQKAWKDARTEHQAHATDKANKNADRRDRQATIDRDQAAQVKSSQQRNEQLKAKAKDRQALADKQANVERKTPVAESAGEKRDVNAPRNTSEKLSLDSARQSKSADHVDTENAKLAKKADVADVAEMKEAVDADSDVVETNELAITANTLESQLLSSDEMALSNPLVQSGLTDTRVDGDSVLGQSSQTSGAISGDALMSSLSGGETLTTNISTAAPQALNGSARSATESSVAASIVNAAQNTVSAEALAATADLASTMADALEDSTSSVLAGKTVDTAAKSVGNDIVPNDMTTATDAKSTFEKMLQTMASSGNSN
ncbi:MAG: hypothetical protein EOO68_37795, partial [Moraxellaceae bacterium]